MNTLLFLFLVWLPLSSVFYSLIKSDGVKIQRLEKKLLFFVLTLPSYWFLALNDAAGKYLGKVQFLSKVVDWFKK